MQLRTFGILRAKNTLASGILNPAMYSAYPIQQLKTNSKFEIILFSLGGAMDKVLFGTF